MKIPYLKPRLLLSLRACLAIAVVTSLMLTGCASAPIPVNYAPSSIKSATGALSVAGFEYLPAEPTAPKPLPANQIRNTALGGGQINLDREVKVLMRDAVFAELRGVGVKTNDHSKQLSGEIEEFLVDDLGFSIDWTLRIKYTLTDHASKTVIFQSVKNTQRKTAKFANLFGGLNEIIKANVDQLLDDAMFLKAIN